jgi:hypothetical protein
MPKATAHGPQDGLAGTHPLDNPVRSSLCGPHAHFAQRRGDVLRYPADVSPFAGLPDRPRPADWADLAALAGPGAVVALAGVARRTAGRSRRSARGSSWSIGASKPRPTTSWCGSGRVTARRCSI